MRASQGPGVFCCCCWFFYFHWKTPLLTFYVQHKFCKDENHFDFFLFLFYFFVFFFFIFFFFFFLSFFFFFFFFFFPLFLHLLLPILILLLLPSLLLIPHFFSLPSFFFRCFGTKLCNDMNSAFFMLVNFLSWKKCCLNETKKVRAMPVLFLGLEST